MKKLTLTILIVITSVQLYAQQTATDSIKQTISTLFDGMRKGDSTIVKSTFAKNMVLQSISDGKDGKAVLSTDNANDFARSVGTPHAQAYDERIVYDMIRIGGDLAIVWAPYKFYLGDKFHHCGVDSFQLMRTPAGWKIIYIVDTRRKTSCD